MASQDVQAGSSVTDAQRPGSAAPSGLDRAMFALLFGMMANAIGTSFLFAVLPPVGRRMGLSDVETGSIVTIGAVLFVLAAPLWGNVSERTGRRPVILMGFGVAAVATALFGVVVGLRLDEMILAPTALGLLIAARVCFALFAGGLFPATQAYIADVTAPDRRAAGMGMLGAAFGIGSVAGPAIAWGFSEISLIAPFFGVAALLGLAGVLVWATMNEAGVPARAAAAVSGPAPLTGIWRHLIIAVLAMSGYGMLLQITALRLQDSFQLTAEAAAADAGAQLMVMALAMILIQAVVVRRLGWGPLKMLQVSAPIAAVAMLALGLADVFALQFVALAVYGATLGLLVPGNIAAISLLAGPTAQGKAAGMNASAQGLGFVIGPVSGAALYGWLPISPYLVAACLLAIVAVLVVTKRPAP